MGFPFPPVLKGFSSTPKSSKVPNTKVRTSHAVTIKVEGITVGMIQSWAPQEARPTMPLFEINAAGKGDMYERIPMNISGTTISVNRVDLYTSRFEQAWGMFFDIDMLTDQSNPFIVKEQWSNPAGTSTPAGPLSGMLPNIPSPPMIPGLSGSNTGSGEEFVIVYSGCWFSSLGRSLPADGDKVVRVNATIDYVKRQRYL